MRKNNRQKNALGKYLSDLSANYNALCRNCNTKADDWEEALLSFLQKCKNLLSANDLCMYNAKCEGNFRKVRKLSAALEKYVLAESKECMEHCDFAKLSESEQNKLAKLSTFFAKRDKNKEKRGWKKLKKDLRLSEK